MDDHYTTPLGGNYGRWYDLGMKRIGRILKRHGRWLVAAGIAGVVFVLLATLFARAFGHVPRYAWTPGAKYQILHLSDDANTLVTFSNPGDEEYPVMLHDLRSVTKFQAWDARRGVIRSTFSAVRSFYCESTLAPNGRYLALNVDVSPDSEGRDVLEIIDLETGQRIARLEDYFSGWARHGIEPFSFSPNGQFLVYQVSHANIEGVESNVALWDLANGKRTRLEVVAPAPDFVFSADGSTLVGRNDQEPCEVVVWDVASGKERRRIRTSVERRDWADKLYVAADGNTIGLCVRPLEKPETDPFRLELWDVATQVMTRSVQVHPPVFDESDPENSVGLVVDCRRQMVARFNEIVAVHSANDRMTIEHVPSGHCVEGPPLERLRPADAAYERLWLLPPHRRETWVFEAVGERGELPWHQHWFVSFFQPYLHDGGGRLTFCDVQTGRNIGKIPTTQIWSPAIGRVVSYFRSSNYGHIAVPYPDGTVAIWDVPPRRPSPLILLLAFLHTALILGPCWYFARRRATEAAATP